MWESSRLRRQPRMTLYKMKQKNAISAPEAYRASVTAILIPTQSLACKLRWTLSDSSNFKVPTTLVTSLVT